jgi:ferredoxin
MADEVEIKFEREKQEGIVAVGTYLIDAARRFGIRFDDACVVETGTHFCSVQVPVGADLLSPETTIENEYFADRSRRTGERLACQTKIEKPGEVVIMTEKKVEEPVAETGAEADKSEQYRKEFADMPLEKKIASLVQLETIALGETVSFIINSPFKIADKLMDVMAEFGFKKEEQEKKAARPAEHQEKAKSKRSKTSKKPRTTAN